MKTESYMGKSILLNCFFPLAFLNTYSCSSSQGSGSVMQVSWSLWSWWSNPAKFRHWLASRSSDHTAAPTSTWFLQVPHTTCSKASVKALFKPHCVVNSGSSHRLQPSPQPLQLLFSCPTV